MSHHEQNAAFLSAIDSASRDAILAGIARHYGVTNREAFEEVTEPEAEHILDYMVEPERSAACLLMKRHGMR